MGLVCLEKTFFDPRLDGWAYWMAVDSHILLGCPPRVHRKSPESLYGEMSPGDLSLGWTDSHITLDSEESISAAHMLGHLGHITSQKLSFLLRSGFESVPYRGGGQNVTCL